MAPALATFRFGPEQRGCRRRHGRQPARAAVLHARLRARRWRGRRRPRCRRERGHARRARPGSRRVVEQAGGYSEDRSCRRPKRFPARRVGASRRQADERRAERVGCSEQGRRSRDRRRARGRGLPGARPVETGEEVGLAEGRDHARDARGSDNSAISLGSTRVAVDRHERRAFRVDEHVGGVPATSRPALTRSSPSQTKSPSR